MRTRLIAVLVALAAVAVFTTEASAMYHAGMGVFMQRDPGAGAGGPARVGSAGPAVGGGFIQRDPTGRNQYADGMNLYQYVRSNPLRYTDPQGLAIHHIYTRETWGFHFEPLTGPNRWIDRVGHTRNVVEVDQKDQCRLEYRGYTDYSSADYRTKYRFSFLKVKHSFDTAARAAVSSKACSGGTLDGLEVTVHHVYRHGGTATISITAGVKVGFGKEGVGNIGGELGATITVPPAEDQSEVIYKYLVCPGKKATDTPTVKLQSRVPVLHSDHRINGHAGPYLADLSGWTP